MAVDRGRILLILISRDVQTAAQLAADSGQSPAETLRHLGQLTDQGFIVVGHPDAGPAVYRLVLKDARAEGIDAPRRILLVEDDLVLRDLVVLILEDEGYAVIGAEIPVDAVTLLEHATFDLVITDGFSETASAVLTSTADVLREAGVVPVALFSGYTIGLEAAQAAGFRDLITKPFDVEALERQVRVLLGT
jgi:CheY-like chemotaxis protein